MEPVSHKNPGPTRREPNSGVQETLPPVLLGRLHLSRPIHVPHIVKASDSVTSERGAASGPPFSARKPLLAAARAAAATPRALSSRATSRGSAGSATATGSTQHEDHQDRKPKHFTAWTQLRTRELAPMPDVEELLGIGPAVSFGHGLLWPGTFQQYAVGWMPGACLGVAEFGRLLRENHVILDYASRCRILELAVGRGAQIIDFPALLSFVEATARSVTLAEDLRASGGPRRGRRKRVRRPEQAAVAVLQAVFNSYDRDGQGELCREDYMRLVRDRGQVPRTPEEFHDLHRQVAFCREDGLPGPLDFAAFIRLVTYLSGAGCA